ncbi:MAG: SIS domain-containing protein [Armatimonadetes bacterium]|nr:SIS domain-containing protein [Armatimonadota bacterium]
MTATAPMDRFYESCITILERVRSEERGSLGRAADLVAEKMLKGELVHVFGTGGHSVMGAMELFWRAGGLAAWNPLFPPGIANLEGHPNTERVVGFAQHVLDYYRIKQGDLLVLINVNGINAVTIDTALECRKRGVTVIAVTSREFAEGVTPGIPARHPSNQNLCDLADVVIDAHVPPGDAVVDIDGFDRKVASISTVINTYIVQSLVAEVVDRIVKAGVAPEVWYSGNMAGAEEINAPFHAKYYSRVKHL